MWAGAYAKEMSVNFYFLELYFFFKKEAFQIIMEIIM